MEELRDHKGSLIYIGCHLMERNNGKGSGVIVTDIDYVVEKVTYKYIMDSTSYNHGFNFIFEVWEVLDEKILASDLITKCISLLNKL